MVEWQHVHKQLNSTRGISLLGSELRTELFPETLDSRHTIHTTSSCLIRKIVIFAIPLGILRVCVIAERMVLIRAGITGRGSLPHAV